MASDAMIDEYLIYDNRLTTFTKPQAVPAPQRRASGGAASSRAPKTLSWPHKSIKPASMAKAGFIFQPLPSNPDNVVCFLCNKALDGWEEDDNPLDEHLKHSPECGWAITAAVEAELGEYAVEDPRDPLMVEARKATFAGRWPHESRKGWTCKTKQLVEAGWRYTPLIGSDDNATCAYCQLALDGWEKTDKPWDEHYNRAPNCPFFSLISSRPAPKRAGRSKAARSSKASRLSLQSVATELPSVADLSADVDDSVMTTASNMTTASKAAKKTTKAKKPAASRAKKTRAKRDEAVEILEDEPKQDEEALPPPAAAPIRGKKRSSDEVEDSVAINAEASAPKKRATKTRKARGSNATEVSQADTDMPDVSEVAAKPIAKRATKKALGSRKASTKSTRKASVATTASATSSPPRIPDDDEIDRQLQADLDRPLTDDEDGPNDADPETKKAAAARKRQSAEAAVEPDNLFAQTSTRDFAMFDPAPPQPSDAQIEADLRSMQYEMEVDQNMPEPVQMEPEPAQGKEPEPAEEELKVPKKGRKAGTRKVSKQTTSKKGKEAAALIEQPQPRAAPEAEEPDELADADVSIVSVGTNVRRSVGRASLGSAAGTVPAKPPAKRGRPPKKKVSQELAEQPVEAAAASRPAVAPEPVVEPLAEPVETTASEPIAEPEVKAAPEDEDPTPAATEAPKKRSSTAKRGRPSKKSKTSQASTEEATVVAPSAVASVEPEPEPEPETAHKEVEAVEAPVQEKAPTASKRGRPSKKSKTSEVHAEEAAVVAPPVEPEQEPEPVQKQVEVVEASIQETLHTLEESPRIGRKPVPAPKNSPFAIERKAITSTTPAETPLQAAPPKTPGQYTSPVQSAKQATVSPSPSPQPSDEENRPPSSRPNTNSSSKNKRLPLGELPVMTPTRQVSMSPSKQQQEQQKTIGGLQSTEAWTAVDLELIFEDQENAGGKGTAAARFFARGGGLTDDERNMTVEEWIYHNAGQAEEKLKHECEAMVMAFEREGTRAMRALEGLFVD